MKGRCRDGCRTSLLIAGVVLVSAIFHTLLPPCHPYITSHFMEMFFSTCANSKQQHSQSTYITVGKYYVLHITGECLLIGITIRLCPTLSWGPNHHDYCTPGDCTCMHAVKKGRRLENKKKL